MRVVDVIGLAGPAGTGKDTVATYLEAFAAGRGRTLARYAFAQPLKAMLAAAGMPEPEDRAAKELPVPGQSFTWRRAAQTLGTEWGRNLDPDIWLKMGENRIIAAKQAQVGIVITDVRFENEAAMIRKHGGVVVHITGRDTTVNGVQGHASEAGLVPHAEDVLLYNGGSLESLVHNVQLFYQDWAA